MGRKVAVQCALYGVHEESPLGKARAKKLSGCFRFIEVFIFESIYLNWLDEVQFISLSRGFWMLNFVRQLARR